MEELKFRTKIGYCHILPDRIVLTRDGVIGSLSNVVMGNSIVRTFIFHTISIIFQLALAFFTFLTVYLEIMLGKTVVAIELFIFALFLLYLAIFSIVGLLGSFNNSATPIVYRNTIEKVKFHKAVPFLTRAYFTVCFRDGKGKRKKRLIMLPGSLSGGTKATQEALNIMKQAKII